MKRITTVISGTGKYEICKDQNGYWAIEHCYLDDNGRLKQEINGIQGALSETYEQAIRTAIFRGKVKEFTEKNSPTEDELMKYMVSIA